MRAGLDRIWRTFATALCYLLFGVGGILVALVAAPILYFGVRSRSRRVRHTRYLISSCFAAFIGVTRLLGVLEYRVEGRERLQQPGCLVIANHPSLIDVVFLIAFMPDVDCVIKRALWRNPITAIPVRLAGYISNGTATELVARCRASLAAGSRLIVFPEGTRSEPGRPLQFQRGAAHIALAANADLLPVTIVMREAALTKGQHWYHVPAKRISLSIATHPPIRLADYQRAYGNTALAARRLTADLQQYFADGLKESLHES